MPQEFVDKHHPSLVAVHVSIFSSHQRGQVENESPVRELKLRVLTALAAELMLILSRWPPASLDLGRPKHVLEEGYTH